MKSEGVKILIHEAIIASWMRIGKPYKKEERTNQYEKNRFCPLYSGDCQY